MANFWVTGDSHLGHKKIIDKLNMPEYNARILAEYARIPYEDVMIHVGDVSFGDDEYWNDQLLRSTSCRKWLVLGNHDKHSLTWYLDKGWDFVARDFTFDRFGFSLWFTHIPELSIEPASLTLNIHGHLHSQSRDGEFKNLLNSSNILYTPEKFNFKPVRLDMFLGDLIKERI